MTPSLTTCRSLTAGSWHLPVLTTVSKTPPLFKTHRTPRNNRHISISAAQLATMYGRLIRFSINKNVQQSTIGLVGVYPTNLFSSLSKHPNKKYSKMVDEIRDSASGMPPVSPSSGGGDNRVPSSSISNGRLQDTNLIDDIRQSASGTPPTSSWSASGDDHINVVKTSTTPSSSISDGGDNLDDMGSYAADTAKQGVAKAIETGLDIGEMAKKTLDNVWDATKDTTHKVKEAVTSDREEGNDVPASDRFVDDLRKRADGYDLRRK